jgi:uncharacterized membrane protein YgaE (UPF0421/DUF939 family)
MKESRMTDMLITVTETVDKKYYVIQIDKRSMHCASSIEDILDSIKEEFEAICHDKNNWIPMEGK